MLTRPKSSLNNESINIEGKMKYFFLIILASIISSCGLDKADTTDVRVPPSDAPSNMGSEYVTMIRNVSCGDWIKEIDEKDPSDSVQSWPMLTNEAWLLGYMSGLSAGKGVTVIISSFISEYFSPRWLTSHFPF